MFWVFGLRGKWNLSSLTSDRTCTSCMGSWSVNPWTTGSVQFSRSVMSDSLRPHGLQNARAPCPSPTPGAYSNSCPLSRWCHPTISSSVVPFSSCPQSFPASGSFQMSQFFISGGQSVGVSASTSVLPMNQGLGIEPAPPALEGEVLIPGPPGKSLYWFFLYQAIFSAVLFVLPKTWCLRSCMLKTPP